MPLRPGDAVDAAEEVYRWRETERPKLDLVRQYWRGRQGLPFVVPTGAPVEVKKMARMARVNVAATVVDSFSQSLFVDGYRGRQDLDNAEVWRAWQANRFDRHQTGLHRSMVAYNTAYTTVLPGTNGLPVMRAKSPRRLTAMYGDDPDWPQLALEATGTDRSGGETWRLYDEEAVYFLSRRTRQGRTGFEPIETREHNVTVGGERVCPVVRYVAEEDLDADDEVPEGLQGQVIARDDPVMGQVAPLMRLQDQIDLTTFSLLVAQHYGAFKQRYILGWIAESEAERMHASAARLMQFEDHPDDVEVGEFAQTNLDGYIRSRQETMKHAAVLAQAPVHELIGEMVNLSAEALAAAEAGRDRKASEQQTLAGESHEQTFQAVASLMGVQAPEDAQVWWRDTTSRSLQQTVDALVKMTQGLGVPPEMLWERVPNTTQQDVERWKAAAQEPDALGQLAGMLDRQNSDGQVPEAA